MTPERLSRLRSVLNRRQPDLTVVTDEVHKERNLAAIIRNCDAVGIDEIHTVVPSEGYQAFSGTSASADKWVRVHKYATVEEPLNLLKSTGFQIIAANLSRNAVDYRELDYTTPTALLLGAEVEGVSQAARALCDREVILPMYGMVESYNVSVACALILAQAQTQRQAAGFYARCRLDKKTYQRRLMQWAYPRIARLCEHKNMPYPKLNDGGELETGN